jgi:hypothetical protein
MTYKISATELEIAIKESVEKILADKINWNHAFGRTTRSDGSVVTGNPRDTIDTAETIESIEVQVSPDNIRIDFTNEDAQNIFNYRGEIDELASNSVLEELSVDVVQFVLQSYFK